MADYVVYEDEEWAAVYKDGKLVRVGESYLADEYLRAEFGVETIVSDAFYLGVERPTREDVASTLTEIHAFEQASDQRHAKAEELLAEAARLKELAEKMLAS